MSLNVLVIPEDFRKDQFILGPVVRRLVAEAGKPHARIEVCLHPVLGGINAALDWEKIEEVIEMYPMAGVFLLIVDRDGSDGRRRRLDDIESMACGKLGQARLLLGENAWQEVEVWALAGQDLPKDWNWQEVREEVHPKEIYFEPLARQRGLTDEPGEGRTTMGRDAAQNYGRVRSRCKEDVQRLEARLRDWLKDR
jgi:hypothetical protein